MVSAISQPWLGVPDVADDQVLTGSTTFLSPWNCMLYCFVPPTSPFPNWLLWWLLCKIGEKGSVERGAVSTGCSQGWSRANRLNILVEAKPPSPPTLLSAVPVSVWLLAVSVSAYYSWLFPAIWFDTIILGPGHLCGGPLQLPMVLVSSDTRSPLATSAEGNVDINNKYIPFFHNAFLCYLCES